MSEKFGIIVSGGPAPGINTVIASVTFTAVNAGHEVVGFQNGVKGIIEKGVESAIKLTPDSVMDIQNEGGSMLGTARFNPFEDGQVKEEFMNVLRECGVTKLVMIGGEGTAYLSLQITKHFPEFSVVHVPKTIDNDLILPNQYPSFGFETARYIGTKLLDTILKEAKTTNRWFIVRTMGRNAGYLALGLGIAAGASLTLIPEQFGNSISIDDIVDVIMPTIIKRHNEGSDYGTIVLAEGLIDKLDENIVEELKAVPRDPVGRLMFSKVSLENLVIRELDKRIKAKGLEISLRPENIGYVLRCADPVPFDVEYTKFLGYGAVKFLLEGKTGIMVVRNYDKLDYVTLESMTDESGRIAGRCVDLESDIYKVAFNFMIR